MGIGGEGSSWKENKKLDLFKRYFFFGNVIRILHAAAPRKIQFSNNLCDSFENEEIHWDGKVPADSVGLLAECDICL